MSGFLHAGGTGGRFPGGLRALGAALLLVLVGCPGPGPNLNECGGTEALLFEGQAAEPGDACGACGDGQLICNGTEALRCDGARALNACGTCQALSAEVNASCGPCNDGTYQCAEDGDVACVGASANNACGGCSELPQTPGEACATAQAPGTWQCAGTEDVTCVDTGTGACGGVADPDPLPGTPCGACGLGRNECDGLAAVACSGEGDGLNACNSCGELTGAPGDACGECGGELVCYQGGLVCFEAGRNRCGGCGTLEGNPGDACTDGFFVCTPEGGVTCQPSAKVTNACGGVESLPTPPGQQCGVCGDGWTMCASPELVVCSGASDTNACGGCGPLQGVPGEICATEGWEWTCTSEKTLTCSDVRDSQPLGLIIEPAELELRVGEAADLTAWLRLTETTREDKTAEATWTSSAAELATVEAGRLTALGAGPVTITAQFETYSAELQLTIQPKPAVMVSLSLDPSPLVVVKGSTGTLQARAHYDDGTVTAATEWANWSAGNPAIATVAGGTVSGHAVGTTQITATFQDFTATAQVEVQLPPYSSMEVTSSFGTVSVGSSVQLMATATRPGEPADDVTLQTAWTVQPAGAGSVDGTGRFTAAASGTVTVQGSFEGLTASVILEVKDPYVSLVVSADPTSIPVGLSSQLMGLGSRQGGTPEEVTAQVTWTVSPVGAGTVDAAGRFTSALVGTATIQGQLDGLTSSVDIEVREPAPVSLRILPDSVLVEKGASGQLEALVELDNGTEENVTAEAAWLSTDTGKATVEGGLVTGIAYGTAEIRATYQGLEASAQVEVPRPPVTTLVLSPGVPLTLSLGTCVPFEVLAVLENEEQVVVTSEVGWSFAGPNLGATAIPGRYCVIAGGNGVVTAQLEGKTAAVAVQGVSRPSHVAAGSVEAVYRDRRPQSHAAAEQEEAYAYRRQHARSHAAEESTTTPVNRRTYSKSHAFADPRSHNVTRP